MMDSNCQVYGLPGVVNFYREHADLQFAEETILNLLKDRLAGMRMLDIGVGGGRTTVHFFPLVKYYIGIDYASNMIKACQQRFSDPKISWKVCDAREMSTFSDGSFDFILFSYNGIDYVNHEDRTRVLNEIWRLLSPSGVFCFSTHNIFYLENYLKFFLVGNPVYAWCMFQRCRQIKKILSVDKTFDHTLGVIVNDGGEHFRVKTYYAHPKKQFDELRKMGFGQIRVFKETDGMEIRDFSTSQVVNSERWFYFLCYKK